MSSPGMQKLPFRIIEISLNKFNDEAIPYHQKLYELYKASIHKLIATNNLEQLKKEVKDKHRIVRQINDLMYELDTLRAQVEDCDLDKFDEKTFSLRRTFTCILKEYKSIERQMLELNGANNHINENIENENPFNGTAQLQINGDIEQLKLQEKEQRLKNVEAIENDVENLHGIYVELNKMVCEQKESVDVVETNVEDTQQNVNTGLKHLISASKYKATTYPLTGAILGSLVGGPLGLVAGAKIGGAAALGCGIMGYAGGRFLKNCNVKTPAEVNTVNNESTDPVQTETVNKKDE